MDKINFEDLPSTNTPISADNLNLMQDNIENEIKNIAIETVTNENGTAIKFADGTMICTGETSVTDDAGNFSDFLPFYRTMTTEFKNFPMEFVGDIPRMTFDVVSCSEPCWLFKWNSEEMQTSLIKPSRVVVMKQTNEIFSGTISYIAIGRWK